MIANNSLKFPRGAEWRKWDLHVHSPASHNYAGDWKGFITQVGNSDCSVIGINDYFSVEGYVEVQRLLRDHEHAAKLGEDCEAALERLKAKTLLPIVECRMTNILLNKADQGGDSAEFSHCIQ